MTIEGIGASEAANVSDASNAVTAQVALKLENVSKSFAGVTVLKDVSFEAKAGRVLAIMGENGAGKSTLKNIMCGLLAPNQGTITVAGDERTQLTSAVAAQLGIAAVHQELSTTTPARRHSSRAWNGRCCPATS